MTVTAAGLQEVRPAEYRGGGHAGRASWTWAWRSASATESITVSAEVSLLKTESGELSHEIEAQHLVDLGLLGIGGTFSSSQGMRFYQAEVALVPGASAPGGGFIFGVRVNGAPNGTQRTQIDGMDGTNQINSVQAGTGASVDAIQETAIQTSNFAAGIWLGGRRTV